MKNLLVALALASSFTALPNIALSQDSGFAAELAYTDINDQQGFDIGIGYNIASSGFNFTPMVGGFVYQGNNDRYYLDASADRCRDRTNGQFATTSLCDATEVELYGKLEATYEFDQFEIGGGYRFSEDVSTPYFTASYRAPSGAGLTANYGDDYVSVGITYKH